MNLNNTEKHPFSIFLNAIFIGIFVTAICSIVLLIPHLEEIKNKTYDILKSPRLEIISMQIISMIGIFILPTIIFSIMVKQDLVRLFNLDKAFNYKKYIYALLLAVVLFPILINIQYFVTQLPIPESLKLKAEAQDLMGKKVFDILLNAPGILNFLGMVLMVGVGAGLSEELFFRGFLMKILEKHIGGIIYGIFTFLALVFSFEFNYIYFGICILTSILLGFLYKNAGEKSKQWLAIFLSSFIFSAFHASIYNLLPIMIVGVLLGFIYTKTNDLKLNIFLHAIYNSFQVILNYMFNNKMINFDIDSMEYVPIYVWTICSVVAVLLVKLIIKSNENISNQN